MKVQVKPINSHYKLTHDEAAELKSIVAQPSAIRQELLRRYAQQHGVEALAHLFAEFIGLTNSVETNAREFHTLFFIVEGGMHPHEAEKLNLPTIQGALQGVRVAIEPVKGMCGGCAYRLGTTANQSECTSQDAGDALENPWVFKCHNELDEDGEPIATCAGFVHCQSLQEAADVA